MRDRKGSASASLNAERVRGWIKRLTPLREICFDYFPTADGSDPTHPSWALMDIEKRVVLDFIDQNGSGPDNHNEISDLLYAAETAGKIVAVACGFYRHPDRAAADEADASQRARLDEARTAVLDPVIDTLAGLAEHLHTIDPSWSVNQHMRAIGATVDERLRAWAEDDGLEPITFDADDVPF